MAGTFGEDDAKTMDQVTTDGSYTPGSLTYTDGSMPSFGAKSAVYRPEQQIESDKPFTFNPVYAIFAHKMEQANPGTVDPEYLQKNYAYTRRQVELANNVGMAPGVQAQGVATTATVPAVANTDQQKPYSVATTKDQEPGKSSFPGQG